jgi:transposase InsO family protein
MTDTDYESYNRFEYFDEDDEDNFDESEEEPLDESEQFALAGLKQLNESYEDSPEFNELDEDYFLESVPTKRKSNRSKSKAELAAQKGNFTKRLSAKTKLLILQAYRNCKMSATVFGSLVGVSPNSIYAWEKAFKIKGPAGLEKQKPGKTGTRLAPTTVQAILMLKEQNEDWGCKRIHEVLLRSEAFSASPGAIRRVLLTNGYEVVEEGTKRHPDKPRRFERAKPQQMYQTDIFTFLLKRQKTRVYMIAYMDDCSRYIVSFGLTVKATSSWAQEILGEAIASYGPPEEVLTDQGPQYHTWRGTSSFNKFVTKCGIKQIVARAHHPQTLGKVERFWQTLWNECIEKSIFKDLQDARERIGQFVGWYNFKRTHQGIDGMFPADRFFGANDTIRNTIETRVEANALEIARHGVPRKPFYLSGRVGDQSISLHAEGEKVVLTRQDGAREEVDLSSTGRTDFSLEEAISKSAALDEVPFVPYVTEPEVPVVEPLLPKPEEPEIINVIEKNKPQFTSNFSFCELEKPLTLEEPEIVKKLINEESVEPELAKVNKTGENEGDL